MKYDRMNEFGKNSIKSIKYILEKQGETIYITLLKI